MTHPRLYNTRMKNDDKFDLDALLEDAFAAGFSAGLIAEDVFNPLPDHKEDWEEFKTTRMGLWLLVMSGSYDKKELDKLLK